MAKMSAVNKNNKRIKLSDKLFKKRQMLKKIIMDKKISFEISQYPFFLVISWIFFFAVLVLFGMLIIGLM